MINFFIKSRFVLALEGISANFLLEAGTLVPSVCPRDRAL